MMIGDPPKVKLQEDGAAKEGDAPEAASAKLPKGVESLSSREVGGDALVEVRRRSIDVRRSKRIGVVLPLPGALMSAPSCTRRWAKR